MPKQFCEKIMLFLGCSSPVQFHALGINILFVLRINYKILLSLLFCVTDGIFIVLSY